MKTMSLFVILFAAPALLCAQSPAPKAAAPAAKKAAVKKVPAKKADARSAAPAKKAEAGPPAAAKKEADKPAAPAKKEAAEPVAVSTAPVVDPFAEVLEKLKSEDADERRMAAGRLGQFRDPRAAPALLAALSDKSPLVRQSAADSLGLLTWREAVPKLSEMLVKDSEPAVRQQAAISLSYMSDPRAGPALAEALKDENQAVCYAALHTLGVLKYLPAEEQIFALLSSRDTNMRRGAIAALGQMQAKNSGAAVAGALADPEPLVRMEAVRAVGEIGYPEAAPELVKLLDAANQPQLRIESATALSRMGMNDGLPAAYEFIKSPEISIRNQAMNIIVAVGDARSLKFIEEVYTAETDPAKKNMLDFARQRLSVRLNRK